MTKIPQGVILVHLDRAHHHSALICWYVSEKCHYQCTR